MRRGERVVIALAVWAVAGCVDEGRSMGDPVDGALVLRDAASDAAPDAAVVDAAVVDAAPDVAIVDAAPDGAEGPPDLAVVEDAMVEPPACPEPVTAGEGAWVHGDARARVVVSSEACRRVFTLSTTAALRDGEPENPRVVRDALDGPVVRTGAPWFDALYALAVEEARENAVDAIRDGAFRDGDPVACPEGGCFETGRLWSYVWTRDTAYALDLGIGALDPVRAANSLIFKTSAPRDGGPRRVVQDTGTGGSWPVSTDRVVWALGARALLPWLDEALADDLRALALEALTTTAADDERVAFDPTLGLYRGEESFLDWREQSYPDWVAGRPAHIAMSVSLSTNTGHYVARRLLADLSREAGSVMDADKWDTQADALRTAIRRAFLPQLGGLPAAFLPTELDRGQPRQHDLLGLSLAILEGLVGEREGHGMLTAWPILPGGPPVIWPQQQFTPIYHNRAQWPFVTAYMLRAAARVQHAAVVRAGVETLMRGAALNLSNMENFEVISGLPWVDDGPYSGPVVDSQRQLWSVAGYLAMVHEVIFGVRVEGDRLFVAPGLTRSVRAAYLGAGERLVLSGLDWRGRLLDVVLNLPAVGDDSHPEASAGYRVVGLRVDGQAVDDPAAGIPLASLAPGRRSIEVDLAPVSWLRTAPIPVDPSDWRQVFAPRSPVIDSVSWAGRGVAVAVSPRDDRVTIDILRDGEVVARDAVSPWVDTDVGEDDQACYTARVTFRDSELMSHHAEPQCWWGVDGRRVQVFEAEALEVLEGERAEDHGRPHVRDPGGAGVAVPAFVARYDGRHAVQVVYGNGGPVESGITCALRAVELVPEDGAPIDLGVVALPHLGDWDRWADSTFAFADLEAGRTYRLVVRGSEVGNMSTLAHFADYTAGPGGVDGPFRAANISAVKVLAFGPAGAP